MLKTIPKSSVNQRSFKVNKTWEVSNTDYPIISGSYDTILSSFDSGSATTQEGVYTGPLFKSIKSQYYTDIGNPFILKGKMDNIGGRDERTIGTVDIWRCAVCKKNFRKFL